MAVYNPNVDRTFKFKGFRVPTANPYARLDYVSRKAPFELYTTTAFNLNEMARNVAVTSNTKTAEMFKAFVEALDKLTSGSKSQMTQMYQQLGSGMQEQTVLAYNQAKAEFGRNIGPYRESKRDAGGRMRRVLRSPGFFRATYDGIGFGNITLLDAEARQWHRLNFGAKPSSGSRTRMFGARFGSLFMFSLGFPNESPSAAFMMPAGYFTEGGRKGQFRPTGKVLKFPTKGIKAWNFLDAGVEYLAENLGPAWINLYREWFASAKGGLGPLSRVVTIKPPSPGVLFFDKAPAAPGQVA